MSTHTASQTATAEPAHVLRLLTDPAACARWAPIKFSTDQAPKECLHAGSRTRLQGRIAGRNVSFDIKVLAADERGLSVRAIGPVRLEVHYRLTPSGCGTLIEAQIRLAQAGAMTGALASRATTPSSALARCASHCARSPPKPSNSSKPEATSSPQRRSGEQHELF